MINIHLYPSPFLNESRILREVSSLSRLALFERIDLIGVGHEGRAPIEDVQRDIKIIRIGRCSGTNFPTKLIRTWSWSQTVFQRYRNEEVGCVNCHSVATLPLGVMLKRATGAKLVYDAHELETETNGLKGFRKFLTKQSERALIRYADHSIFVGAAIEQWYVREYGLRSTTVLYNCPLRRTVKPTDYFRKTFSIRTDVPIFLYQGVIGAGRGIPKLVEAFSSLAGRAALIVMGYGSLADWTAREATRRPGIYFHPAVAPEHLLDYTAAADFGVSMIEATSLSYDYCMPNKLFEYVMANKPVLVSPTREQSDFVRKYDIGEIAADTTPAVIRDSVLKLISRDPLTFQAALKRAADEYCWEGQEPKLYAVYRDSLGMRSSESDDASPQMGAQHDFRH
jgi:glycosyltransferase involved in cell wall biosynthesis